MTNHDGLHVRLVFADGDIRDVKANRLFRIVELLFHGARIEGFHRIWTGSDGKRYQN